VGVEYEFVLIHKNAVDDQSKQDIESTTNSTDDLNLESPSKMGKLKKGAYKFASGVKAAFKTASSLLPSFSKTEPHKEKKTHSYIFSVSDKGIDAKGKPRQSLSTTRLIRDVDIKNCDSVSISVTPKNCYLSKSHLFVRYDI